MKGHLPVIAKVQDPTNLAEMSILAGRLGDRVAEIYGPSQFPAHVTRDQLVKLHADIGAWLEANPA